MASITRSAIARTAELLTAPAGLNGALAEMSEGSGVSLPGIEGKQILTQNVAAELAEKSLEWRYPAITIYCEKIRNELKEKFRTFSGLVQLTVEVRVTHDRLDGLETAAETYASAVMQVLDKSRGDWGNGMHFGGEYEVEFGPVKRGGRGFLQIAKVRFEVFASR